MHKATASKAIGPSKMACQALGLKPEYETKAAMDTDCAMCGDPIAKNESCADRVDGPLFNDHTSMANALSVYICGACRRVTRADYMAGYSDVVITPKAVYPFGTNVARSWFLLSPPKPPFVMHVHDSKNQHLTWRSPINLSQSLLRIRMGNHLLTVRVPILKEAVARYEPFAEMIRSITGREMVSRIHNKFESSARALKSNFACLVKDNVRAMSLTHKPVAAELEFYDRMTIGETWALLHIINTPKMERPAALSAPSKKSSK